MTVETSSPEETEAVAARLAAALAPGDVVTISGELGAGKTTFVRGACRALGVTEPVTSPTFVLVHNYAGRLPIVHLDVYRLDHLQEVVDLGLAEMLDEGGVALIEWGDMAAPSLPADFLEVRIDYGEADDERRFDFRIVGPSWAPRSRALQSALSRWSAA